VLGSCSEKINQTDCKKIALARDVPDKIEKLDTHEKNILKYLNARDRDMGYVKFYRRCLALTETSNN
jgi:hypothetical protein